MKSEWYVSCNPVGGEYLYIAMRTRDLNVVKHSGNVETYGEYSTDREAIQKVVDKLNQEEMGRMYNLKPCPFCGGEATLDCLKMEDNTVTTIYQISCKNVLCGVGPSTSRNTLTEVIDAWNRRAKECFG